MAKPPQEPAVYECRCGNQVEFRHREWPNLHWLRNKFGFTNIGAAIGHQQDCCDRPEYASVGEFAPVGDA